MSNDCTMIIFLCCMFHMQPITCFKRWNIPAVQVMKTFPSNMGIILFKEINIGKSFLSETQ